MKFTEEKKRSIKAYIVEKIANNTPNVSKHVAETFNISRNTVNAYMLELQDSGIIRKVQKNQYELSAVTYKYRLQRSKGELNGEQNADEFIYEKCFRQHLKGCSQNAIGIWDYAMKEMLNNVIDHANANNMNLIIKKDFLRMSVIIADDGVGIFEKIKDYFQLESLDAARCELFKGKLTTNKQKHSGEGIFFTSRMMDDFLILSSGKVFSTNKYNSDANLDVRVSVSKGTCVYMTLANNTRRSTRDVFDKYSNVECGFDKTMIPLKNIFDDAPVSRSQAKRVCYRLDQFAEITLDFAGLDWMGQAFAHELFIIYQREHPNTVIKPINMSEGVKRMYLHVINTKYN